MIQKTSDIVIDTIKDRLYYCIICKKYVPSEEFDHTQQKCKTCNKGISNETDKQVSKS